MKRTIVYILVLMGLLLACGQGGRELPTRASKAVLTRQAELPPTYTPAPLVEPQHQRFIPGAQPTVTPYIEVDPAELVVEAAPPPTEEVAVQIPGDQDLAGVPNQSVGTGSRIGATTGSLRVDDWDIRVERVNFFEEITNVGGDMERATGKYVVVFLAVTNHGPYSRTFTPISLVAVRDTDGWEYEEDMMASTAAWWTFNTDIGADIEPGQTEHMVAAFDVHEQSNGYWLVPGWRGDDLGGAIALSGSLTASAPPTRRPDIWDTFMDSTSSSSSSTSDYGSSDYSSSSSSSGCCKVCTTGKPCGNSCINRNYTCHQPPGCAC